MIQHTLTWLFSPIRITSSRIMSACHIDSYILDNYLKTIASTYWPRASTPIENWYPLSVQTGIPDPLITTFLLVAIAITTFVFFKTVDEYVRPLAAFCWNQPKQQIVVVSVQFGGTVFAFFIVLVILGFQPIDVLISRGIPATVSSVFIGLLLGGTILFFLPYKQGDVVEIPDLGRIGMVEEITLLYTKIYTFDKTLLVISNRRIAKRDIINQTYGDDKTRHTLDLAVSYDSDLDDARNLIVEAAKGVDKVIVGQDVHVSNATFEADPTCHISGYGDNGVLLTLWFWTEQPYGLPSIRGEILKRVTDSLENENVEVEIPYPHRQLLMDGDDNEIQVVIEGDTT